MIAVDKYVFGILMALALTVQSCEKDNITVVLEFEPPEEFSIIKVGTDTENFYNNGEKSYLGQGVAIVGQTMYRLYNYGYCRSYDISNLSKPTLISSFALGSHSSSNHSNCAQFFADSDDRNLLYVSGLRGKCFVEEITPEASILIQTINFPSLEIFNGSNNMNIICGDDGYLWIFGDARSSNILHFAKVVRPDPKAGDVTLTEEDIVDSWSQPDYIYDNSVWQGGMVRDGKLYYVFGTKSSRRHIAVYNTVTHEQVHDIDINETVKEEPEDCDLLEDGRMVLAIAGGKGFYVLNNFLPKEER